MFAQAENNWEKHWTSKWQVGRSVVGATSRFATTGNPNPRTASLLGHREGQHFAFVFLKKWHQGTRIVLLTDSPQWLVSMAFEIIDGAVGVFSDFVAAMARFKQDESRSPAVVDSSVHGLRRSGRLRSQRERCEQVHSEIQRPPNSPSTPTSLLGHRKVVHTLQ